jgi:hypothetical protein
MKRDKPRPGKKAMVTEKETVVVGATRKGIVTDKFSTSTASKLAIRVSSAPRRRENSGKLVAGLFAGVPMLY